MKIIQRQFIRAAILVLLVGLPSGCTRKAKAEGRLDAAKEYFAKADDAAAEIEFKNVLKLEPGHPQALKGLGIIWVRQGAMLDGGRFLSAAKSQLSTDDEIGVNLALAFIDLGFMADGRKEILDVLDRTPAHGEALMLLADTSLTPQAMTECEARITRAKAGDKAPVLLASALIEFRRGHIDAGTQTLERVLKLTPESPRALALQATLFRLNKQPEKALLLLKKASTLAGVRSSECAAYASLLMQLGHQDDALALLKDATKKAPAYLPNWRLLALIAYDAGNDAEAAADLSKVLAKCPLDIEASLLQSQLWLRAKQPAKAVELMEKLTSTFPSRPQFELVLGKAYLAADDSIKATSTLDRVLAIAPGHTEATLLRSSLFLKDARPGEAIRLVEPVLAAEPTNRMAQDLLVAAYSAANRLDDAIAIVQQQAAALPRDDGPQILLGQLLRAQGKTAEARTTLERVLVHSPNQLAALIQLVALDELQGKRDDALARTNTYLANHPDSSQAHFIKAQLYYAAKNFKAAETEATKTIELKPNDTQAYGMLVSIQCSDSRSDMALGKLRELLEISPNNTPAMMHLGSLLMQLGRLDEARANFSKMIELYPNIAAAYNNLADIDSRTPGNLPKALEYALKARSLAPDDPSISDTYGWIQWLRGDYRQALPLIQEAAKRLPEAASVQYHLAMAHYMMHQTTEAMAALEKSLAIPGEFPEKDQASGHLAILRDGVHLDLTSLENHIKETPKDVVIMILMARKLATVGRPQDAIEAYQSALTINPDLAAAYLGLADLYTSALNQPDKALVAANQARKVSPQCPHAAAILGSVLFRLAKHEDAYNLLAEAAHSLPNDAEVQYNYAWAAYSTGRVSDARSTMGKLTACDPARTLDVNDFLALTDPDAPANADTTVLSEKKLAANPTYVPALMVRATLLEINGQCPLPSYTKVLEVFPQFDPARKALARVYLDDPTQLDAAEKLANAARERLKDDPDLSGILAIINFRKGQFDYATQILTELAAIRPLQGGELFALGMSQAATKRSNEARQTLALALNSKLQQADASTAKATLEILGKSADDDQK
ncbi:MAG: tetratricopeptide repeat protein [Verrucomicrobiota bacterium]